MWGFIQYILIRCVLTVLNKISFFRDLMVFPVDLHTVDSAYNIHGYKGQPVIAATKIMSQNLH